MYSIIFTQAARAELIEAQDWYENQATGLGQRFRQAIDALTERMSNNPWQFPTVFKEVRRALLHRFPYTSKRDGASLVRPRLSPKRTGRTILI